MEYALNRIRPNSCHCIMTNSPNAAPIRKLREESPDRYPMYMYGVNQRLISLMEKIGSLAESRFWPTCILDDCLKFPIPIMHHLCLTSRNQYLSSIIATHYIKFLRPEIRDNINYVIFMHYNEAGAGRLMNEFFGKWLNNVEPKHMREFYVHYTSLGLDVNKANHVNGASNSNTPTQERYFFFIDNILSKGFLVVASTWEMIPIRTAFRKYQYDTGRAPLPRLLPPACDPRRLPLQYAKKKSTTVVLKTNRKPFIQPSPLRQQQRMHRPLY